jgi:hypothetical protein
MSTAPAAARVESNGSVTVFSTTGGIVCKIAPSYGKATSANVNGMVVIIQTDQGYLLFYDISGYSPILKLAK